MGDKSPAAKPDGADGTPALPAVNPSGPAPTPAATPAPKLTAKKAAAKAAAAVNPSGPAPAPATPPSQSAAAAVSTPASLPVVEETEPIASVGGVATSSTPNASGAGSTNGNGRDTSTIGHPSADARVRALEVELAKANRERNEAHLLYKAAEASIADLRTARSANGQHHISMRFSEPGRTWVGDMVAAQRCMEAKLAEAGSLLKPEPLKTPASALTVDPTTPNELLRADQLFYRFKRLIDSPALLAELSKKIAALKNPSAPGDRVVALNEINETLHLSGQRMCIIICGHESAGTSPLRMPCR